MNHQSIIKLPVAELKTAIGGLSKVLHKHSTLPVLGMICVERDRQGWVHLTATDLDSFLSLRLEAPGSIGEPVKFLVPYIELQKLGKTCPADEELELEPVGEDKVILRHRIGSHPVEQVIASVPVDDFPETPHITVPSVSLDEAARSTLLDALLCASDDETRVILNGAYLDVSKPAGHYVVATDGRHLFASNSLRLPLASSVLIPDHRFLSWNAFAKDGQWQLAVQPPTKDKGGWLRLESRRWTFTTKQIEGNYPNWRAIAGDVSEFTGSLEFSEQAAAEAARIIPRLPGDSLPNRTVGLCVYGKKLFLRGWNQGQERATEVEVPGVAVSGQPDAVYCNRQYLLRALGFGLRRVGVQETLKPLRFQDESGSRQMIVMPVRVEANANGSKPGGNGNVPVPAPTPNPSSPTSPVPASSDAAPAQPQTLHPNPQPQPHGTERNHPPMQNGNTTTTTITSTSTPNGNGNGHQPAAPQPEEKPSLEQALDQIESIKAAVRSAVGSLNLLADTLRQVQRDRRMTEREVRSVRDTLKSLQTVRL